MSHIKALIASIAESGLKLPHAYDPTVKRPSFRLLAAYISFLLACASTIVLHFDVSLVVANIMTLLFFVLCMVFYMLKKLNNAKIDLDDRSVELNSEDKK